MTHRSGSTRGTPVPEWIQRAWHSPWPWMALVGVLFCMPLFTGLDRQDLDNDEAIYSFAVNVMLKTGDWLTPRSIPSETAPFLEKPPLKFWIVALPIHWGLLPANEFGMRFWDAVMASIAFLYIFAIGRRLAGPICGFTAVLLLFTHGPLMLEHGLRTNNMEASVFLAYAAGMYHFLAWRRAGPDARGHVFAMALFFVLGFMTKFVAALFLPLVLAMAALTTREDRLRLRLQWPTYALAALTALAIIAPWFVYQYAANGPTLFETMYSQHVVKRFTAYLDPAHLHPWHYYFTELWTQLRMSGARLLVLAGAGLVLVQVGRRRWAEGALLILWFGVPLAAISFGTSKLYHYAYPFLPPVALAGGCAAEAVARLIWRWFEGPAAALLRLRARLLPRALTGTTSQAVMTIISLACLAVAGATALVGRTTIAVGGTLLARNSSVVRPLAAGAAALLAGGTGPILQAMPPAVAWLGLMPLERWRGVLRDMHREQHLLRDTRDCLAPVVERIVVNGQPRPGVLVEGQGFSHRYTYYLYGLGPWEQRDVESDGTVAMHLFAPNSFRPVLLGTNRYRGFMERVATSTEAVLALAARRARMSPDDLLVEFRTREVGVVPLDGAVLLLPGPYAECSGGRSR